jgi:hypothetical protein
LLRRRYSFEQLISDKNFQEKSAMAELFAEYNLNLTQPYVYGGSSVSQINDNQAYSLANIDGQQYLSHVATSLSPTGLPYSVSGVQTTVPISSTQGTTVPVSYTFNFGVSATKTATPLTSPPGSFVPPPNDIARLNIPNEFNPALFTAVGLTASYGGSFVVVPTGVDPSSFIPNYTAPVNSISFTLSASGYPVGTTTLTGNAMVPSYIWIDLGPAPGTQLAGQIVLNAATEHVALPATTTIATFTDSNTSDLASGFTATINWGDTTTSTGTITGSNGSFVVTGGHTYAGEGTAPVSVTITRTADSTQVSPSANVTVGENDALTGHGTTVSADSSLSINGTLATFTDTDTVSPASDFTASINWGDGKTSNGAVSGSNGSFQVSGTHTYAPGTSGQDTVAVTLTDNSPGTATATANTTVVFPGLFTTGADTVDFNNLTAAQQQAIAAGADTTHGLGGNDNVTLPNSGSATFYTGSTASDTNYRVTGGGGNYNIVEGAGTEFISITGGGSSTIYAATGSDTIVINGSGVNTIHLGTATANITLSGSNNNIDFDGHAGTANLFLQKGFQENINGFTSGDFIDLVNVGNVTFSAAVTSAGVLNPGEVDLYQNGSKMGSLFFDASVDYTQLKPTSDGTGGTEIVLDSAPGPQDPSGTQINWSFVHNWESDGEGVRGETELAPYIPPDSGSTTPQSGLTMAQGVDIGDQGNAGSIINGFSIISGLLNSWQSDPNIAFISTFINKTHSQALASLVPSKPVRGNPTSTSVSLTTTQANAITNAVETAIYNQLSQDYTAAAAKYNKGGWNTLSANRQTAIFDLAYNIGLHRNLPHHGIEDLTHNNNLWTLLAQQNWPAAAARMATTGGLPKRRQTDANLLLDGLTASLPVIESGQQVASNDTSYSFSISDNSTQYVLDPAGPYLTLTTDSGSPNMTSIQLPDADGTQYLVSYKIGTSWSTPQLAQPDDTLTFPPGGTDGVRVTMLDSNGNIVQGSPDFVFYLTFASSGTFSGNVYDDSITVNATTINAANGAAVPFTIAGLDADDTGTVTFTDANGKTVQVNVNGGQTSYTADVTSLADSAITSSLAVKPDAAGNTFVPVSGTTVTLTQLDHWTNASGGNWTAASSWSTWNGTHAVPTATIDADFDASGTYAVNITTADTAYALLLNDSGATVSDNSGGSLTLTGVGGAQTPNGVLSINQGRFVLAGGGLRAGSISIGAGGTFLVTQGQYTGQNSIPAVADNGSFTLANNANANIAGSVSGAGAFTVGDNANLTVSGADTVTGSFTIGNNSILEFVAPETAKIILAGSNSLLKLDAVSPTGQISGLNANDKIDLAGLRWVQGSMTAKFSGNTSGGILTVSNGAQSEVINLAGNYMQSSWHLSADKTGGTFVVDPPAVASNTAPGENTNNGTVSGGELLELKTGTPENVQFAAGTGTLQLDDAQHFAGLISGFSGQDVLDLADIAFSQNMSLGYAANSNNSVGNFTVNDGTHVASLPLLGNYMASSFAASSDGHGGTFIEPSQIASYQQSVLTYPHA